VVQVAYVSSDQLERARRIPVLDYVIRHESENLKRVGNEYRLRDHESLAVGEKGWYWHSKGKGSKAALDFLIDVRGYNLVDAVCLLLGEWPHNRENTYTKTNTATRITASKKAIPPPERLSFAIPRHNRNNDRVIAYLQSRGIDRVLILDCIKRGDLYESAYRHDCVFKGKDEKGKARYAAIRSTSSGFKGDAEGSDKRFSFLLPPTDPDTKTVAVYESPIDALSSQTMCLYDYIPPFSGWRLSFGGTSILGLEYFLECHPKVNHFLICTDNDVAGDKTAARIAELSGVITERVLPPVGIDWNDALLALQKAERTQNRAQSIARHERG